MATLKELVLVTGGNGFLAQHCIIQLLQKGYNVRTTIRSIQKRQELINLLAEAGVKDFQDLDFVQADLTSDKNWEQAVFGCDYVLHVASPIGLAIPKDENEMIRPAVDGTLRVLKAARDAGVKRTVMTSNFGAVGYSHKDPTTLITEESWTDPNEKGLTAYNKSKILAERAAWAFMKKEGGEMEFSVINPVGIFGPYFGGKLSGGFDLLKRVLDGSMKSIPNMTISAVDVRDLADLHIRAMINPKAKGERFLALAGGVLTLPDIAAFLKSKLGEDGNKISTKTLPNWIVRLAGLFSPIAKAVAPQLGKYRNASNEKARTILGWQPRTDEEALLASANSIIKYSRK